MTNKEKLVEIKEQWKKLFEENKKLLIIASSVLVITMASILNIHLFQMSYYTMQGETAKVIELLSKDVQKEFNQDDWYFKKGIRYLTDHLEGESNVFLEENFKYFLPEIQQGIITAYNEQQLVFQKNTDIFNAILAVEDTTVYSKYMKRLSVEQIEQALKGCFGEKPVLTQDVVERLYKILSLQHKKITLDTLQLNMYELMSFPHNGDMNSLSLKLLDCIEAASIKENLFTELKTIPIEIELFASWVDILNRKKVITTSEYANFTSSYGNIKRIQDQYKQVLLQEVDLLNVKQMIDVQTEEKLGEITKLTKEIETLDANVQKENEKLRGIKTYKTMEFYVLDQYPDGDYEAAIPEKSLLFGKYKPGKQRIRLKLNTTQVLEQGVMAFEVHNRGKDSDGLPYYVEVTSEEKEEIASIEQQISTLQDEVVKKQESIKVINQEIEKKRKESGYEQTLTLIEEVQHKKSSLEIDIKKEKLVIQNAFQIGELIVELKK